MNEPTPVVMPSPVWNPNYSQPDLGGSAYTNMANSLSKSMMEGTASIQENIKGMAGTHQLLQVLGNAKNPDGSPMLDQDMIADLSTKGLAAQQKGVGLLMGSVQQQMQAQNEKSAQQKMLQMYQQNPALMQQKLLMSTTPGQRPPMLQPSPTPGPQPGPPPTPSPSPKFQIPPNAAANGYYSQEVQHNGKTVHALMNPQGNMVNVFNPDGSVYTP